MRNEVILSSVEKKKMRMEWMFSHLLVPLIGMLFTHLRCSLWWCLGWVVTGDGSTLCKCIYMYTYMFVYVVFASYDDHDGVVMNDHDRHVP